MSEQVTRWKGKGGNAWVDLRPDSGWRDAGIRPIDMPCAFPEDRLETYSTRLGPVGLILSEADDSVRADVVTRVRAAFEPFVDGADVRYTAACWLVDAKA